MSENLQVNQVSGSIYADAAVLTDNKALQGRLPSLGQKVWFRDGREFVFCCSKVSQAVGEMVGMNLVTALGASIDNACTAAGIGATEITINTKTTAMFGGSAGVLAADALAGGYIVINDEAGEGYQYRIKSNTAGTSAASVTITLFDPLKIAVTAATDVILVPNRYYDCIQGTATTPPVGVVMAVTDGAGSTMHYFWAQTKGIAAVKVAAATYGQPLSMAASGLLTTSTAATEIMAGVALATEATSGQTIPVLLRIGA